MPPLPRLLGSRDRNPHRRTYGCLDRQYWHYRTSDFPSEMYQEGVLPLALVYRQAMPGNRWHGRQQVREWAVAALRFCARSCHGDGSCDDYYPFERALGAAVFSLRAGAEAYSLLELHDDEILAWLRLRATWVAGHQESGRLANHHALAALGLLHAAQVTGQRQFVSAAQDKLRQVLSWQSDEGWFDEYGGPDPGYQTVTTDCLANCRRLLDAPWLDEPLRRATAFARWFLHPDGSYGGEYGSRGTHHFYPHGMELLASSDANAADLADGFLRALAAARQAYFDDDRLFAHRLGNLLLAYRDWSPNRAVHEEPCAIKSVLGMKPDPASTVLCSGLRLAVEAADEANEPAVRHFSHGRLWVRRAGKSHTVISAARGGVFKHFAPGVEPVTDGGLLVEFENGRLAVSHMHDTARQVERPFGEASIGPLKEAGGQPGSLAVQADLHYTRHEVATPLKFAIFRLGLITLGRCCRTLVRRLLQRRLITGRRAAPVRLTRRFDFLDLTQAASGTIQALPGGGRLRVTDLIELLDDTLDVRRMSFGVDHFSTYTAAAGVYQEGSLAPWTDLAEWIEPLNRDRRAIIVREYPCS
ncbi:MAG: hypothetical protein AB7O62_15010 [Pirellulales bacterium]